MRHYDFASNADFEQMVDIVNRIYDRYNKSTDPMVFQCTMVGALELGAVLVATRERHIYDPIKLLEAITKSSAKLSERDCMRIGPMVTHLFDRDMLYRLRHIAGIKCRGRTLKRATSANAAKATWFLLRKWELKGLDSKHIAHVAAGAFDMASVIVKIPAYRLPELMFRRHIYYPPSTTGCALHRIKAYLVSEPEPPLARRIVVATTTEEGEDDPDDDVPPLLEPLDVDVRPMEIVD